MLVSDSIRLWVVQISEELLEKLFKIFSTYLHHFQTKNYIVYVTYMYMITFYT